MQFKTAIVGLLALLLAAPAALACLWDSDTLAMERKQFPGALELITGKFLRHSQEFYKWRRDDRIKRIAAGEVTPALYDDLAVAHEKLGDHAKAIQTIQEKDAKFPGLYETHANLATFLMHNGEMEKGRDEVVKAIEINPDAHFGREIYQKMLADYVLKQQAGNPNKLPLEDLERTGMGTIGFARYIFYAPDVNRDGITQAEELEKAVKGVLGMMRFANYESPLLLEALGDLFMSQHLDSNKGNEADNSRNLAARAYLKASYVVKDKSASRKYRNIAAQSLSLQTRGDYQLYGTDELTLTELEGVFSKEIEEASRWHNEVKANEVAWIKAGKNVDEEFEKMYPQEPELSPSPPFPTSMFENSQARVWPKIIAALICVPFLIVAIRMALRPKKQLLEWGQPKDD